MCSCGHFSALLSTQFLLMAVRVPALPPLGGSVYLISPPPYPQPWRRSPPPCAGPVSAMKRSRRCFSGRDPDCGRPGQVVTWEQRSVQFLPAEVRPWCCWRGALETFTFTSSSSEYRSARFEVFVANGWEELCWWKFGTFEVVVIIAQCSWRWCHSSSEPPF